MKLNLAEIGRDDAIPEGIFSIATADLGAQYYMIKRQHPNNPFAGGQLIVFKVEVVKSRHEEERFRREKWWIWYSEDMSQTLAYKMFAFISNRGVSVWKRFQDSQYPLGDAKTIADTPATITITEEDLRYEHQIDLPRRLAKRQSSNTSVGLWMSYAEVLWEFLCKQDAGRKRIDDAGRTIVTQLSERVPGGAIRPLDDRFLNVE